MSGKESAEKSLIKLCSMISAIYEREKGCLGTTHVNIMLFPCFSDPNAYYYYEMDCITKLSSKMFNKSGFNVAPEIYATFSKH